MGFSPLANKTTDTFQKSSRNGQRADFFGVHHAASTSHQAVVNMMTSGSRQVSAHYVVSDIIEGVVDEDYRAWSLGSSYWDSRMVTVETINNSTNGWTVSDKTFDNLARLIADWAKRYNRPITDDTVLTHQEVYARFGESYPTACPGDLQRRKPELLALANKYLSENSNSTPHHGEEEDDDMKPTVHVRTEGSLEYTLAHPEIGTDLKPGQKRAEKGITVFRGYQVTSNAEIGKAWARMYSRGAGSETSRTNRADYIRIQEAAQQVSLELSEGAL